MPSSRPHAHYLSHLKCSQLSAASTLASTSSPVPYIHIFLYRPVLTEYPSVLGLGRMAYWRSSFTGRRWEEQWVGKAEGQEKLTVQYTYLSWVTPPYVCMCVRLSDICWYAGMQTNGLPSYTVLWYCSRRPQTLTWPRHQTPEKQTRAVCN